jgi:flagellar basal-body rod protein FlgF
MSEALAALSDAMRNDAETLRSIGQNIANIDSTAYRREITVAHPSFDEVQDAARAASVGAVHFDTVIDRRPGTLKNSGEPLHLALEGPGFFVVEMPDGSEALTRRGDLRVDSEGRLTTQQGMPLLGDNGVIRLAGTPQIGVDGLVSSGSDAVDRIRVAQVAPDAQLAPLGGDLYRAAQLPDADAAARVRQGFLETSNVDSVQEMLRLIETMRHFESVQRFVRGYDDMVGKAISELGKV